jgi:hypothetical protein
LQSHPHPNLPFVLFSGEFESSLHPIQTPRIITPPLHLTSYQSSYSSNVHIHPVPVSVITHWFKAVYWVTVPPALNQWHSSEETLQLPHKNLELQPSPVHWLMSQETQVSSPGSVTPWLTGCRQFTSPVWASFPLPTVRTVNADGLLKGLHLC